MRITIKNLQKTIPIYSKKIKRLIRKVLSEEIPAVDNRPGFVWQVNVYFVTAAKILQLNRRYLGRDAVTDVLAFDLGDGEENFLCEIFVSADTAVSNSRDFKTTPAYESYLYVVHGLLHILGYDDKTAKGSRLMRRKEKKYLQPPKINPRYYYNGHIKN